jgi:molybdopterin-containing oxidoreductase family iron-sulfur binding subunit
MKRRDFLKIAPTVGAAGLILDGCGKPEKLIPLLVAPDEFVPYQEGWVQSVCQTCSAGCGILVRVMQGESVRMVDGQEKRVKAVMAKKIEGNPQHLISLGGTRARGKHPSSRSTIPIAFRDRSNCPGREGPASISRFHGRTRFSCS